MFFEKKLFYFTDFFIHSSVSLQPFVGLWPPLQFRNLFYTDGRTPWTKDQPVARPLSTHRTTQTQNKRIHTPNIHALSGIRTHDRSVRSSEGSSCLRPCGHRDRHFNEIVGNFSNWTCIKQHLKYIPACPDFVGSLEMSQKWWLWSFIWHINFLERYELSVACLELYKISGVSLSCIVMRKGKLRFYNDRQVPHTLAQV
jgi:hypothetical protein